MDKHLKGIKKSDNEKSSTFDTFLQEEKFSFPMTCRPPSEFFVTNNKFYKEKQQNNTTPQKTKRTQ